MATDDSISRLDLPYQNIVLAGFVGVGKTTVGKAVAQRLEVDVVDIDEEIVKREGMSITSIREELGDQRLRMVEHELCRDATLKRQAVIVVGGGAMLDQRNANRLSDSGRVVCLTCELGEALRRLHIANEETFRDPQQRRHLLSRLRREYDVVEYEECIHIDTTHLTVEQVADEVIHLWQHGEPKTPEIARSPSHKLMEESGLGPRRDRPRRL